MTFVIRQPQMDVLHEELMRQTAERQVRTHFPAECEQLGGEQLTELVVRSLARARRLGFTSDQDALQYVHLVIALEERFEEKPQYAWAQRIIAESAPDRRPFRATRLYEAALRHLRRQGASR